MKKVLCIILTLTLLAGVAVFATSCGGEDAGEVNVYAWGDYFAEGSDGYRDTIAEFEEETGVAVNLTTYETNEQLYEMLSTTNSSYDVIFPSDYMVEKLIKDDLIQKLDYAKIPNSEKVIDRFKKMDYDPQFEYTVPYLWNVTGLIYNKKFVDGEPDSWEALWDKKYSGKILQFDNSRDAYAIAMQLCGIDPSTFTKDDIDKASEKLWEQKPLLKKYAMDQTFSEMEKNQSVLAPYYAGDIYMMTTRNKDLVGVLPKEGSNLFVDSMCVPKSSENTENAYKFIDFMTRPEISAANSEYDTYASPVEGAKELIEDTDLTSSELVYPPEEYLEKCYTFRNVDDETYNYLREKFLELKA